ncbi:hypothetical protein PGT21_016860 [Puccinia graminis f. sp. tritici]|uniref:Uncharacterized protein n=1 Tax=Puccinia graminis f. sp. tritici TaxID=56615 RepID=A0A5B0NRU7_PUCGR|nr:hypothetical protein PGTUg99_025685 [Puccinia graminis f. sp. tritici]KAA1090880.1 hypothetical protein PGT21_016860 [Puccinia graminis f. sp. tritici]
MIALHPGVNIVDAAAARGCNRVVGTSVSRAVAGQDGAVTRDCRSIYGAGGLYVGEGYAFAAE